MVDPLEKWWAELKVVHWVDHLVVRMASHLADHLVVLMAAYLEPKMAVQWVVVMVAKSEILLVEYSADLLVIYLVV